jgi:hypothetical protein
MTPRWTGTVRCLQRLHCRNCGSHHHHHHDNQAHVASAVAVARCLSAASNTLSKNDWPEVEPPINVLQQKPRAHVPAADRWRSVVVTRRQKRRRTGGPQGWFVDCVGGVPASRSCGLALVTSPLTTSCAPRAESAACLGMTTRAAIVLIVITVKGALHVLDTMRYDMPVTWALNKQWWW